MIKIFKTNVFNLCEEIPTVEPNCWISVVSPDEIELRNISKKMGIPYDFFTDALDPDERARIEIEDNVLLIIFKAPIRNDPDADIPFNTIPIGIILKDDFILTVCTQENKVIEDFIHSRVKNFLIGRRNQFVIQLFHHTSILYLHYLKEINVKTGALEDELEKSMKNRELMRLLSIEKSLVYFMTALKANEIVMERILRTDIMKLVDDHKELLDDAITENKQAIEMTRIYTNILSGMMDTFASIISNNLNMVMKLLTSVTIIIMLPNLIASIYGMNIELPFQNHPMAFPIVIGMAVVFSLVGAWLLFRRNYM